MDNKKWYNRFSTIFWWILAILPLLISVVAFVGNLCAFRETGSVYTGNFNELLGTYCYYFKDFSFPAITAAFDNVFSIFGLTSSSATTFGALFGYMISINMYHVVFDVLVWLPHKAHCLMED